MARHTDPASQIVQFFMSSPPDVADTLYRVIRGIIKTRGIDKAIPVLGRPARRPGRPRNGRPINDVAADAGVAAAADADPLMR